MANNDECAQGIISFNVTDTAEGAVFAVKAKPGASKNEIAGLHNRELQVKVTAAPEKGKANRAILSLLAKELGVTKSTLSISSGELNSHKKVLASGLDSVKLCHKIKTCLGATDIH